MFCDKQPQGLPVFCVSIYLRFSVTYSFVLSFCSIIQTDSLTPKLHFKTNDISSLNQQCLKRHRSIKNIPFVIVSFLQNQVFFNFRFLIQKEMQYKKFHPAKSRCFFPALLSSSILGLYWFFLFLGLNFSFYSCSSLR